MENKKGCRHCFTPSAKGLGKGGSLGCGLSFYGLAGFCGQQKTGLAKRQHKVAACKTRRAS